MNKMIGIFAVLTALIVMLGGVMAQDPAKGDPAKGAPGAGGKGGKGGFGKANPLASAETFLAKYDTNTDKKVTKDEYMAVSKKDAETQWDTIAGAGKTEVTEAQITKYIEDNPPFGGGKGAGGFGGKGGKGADGAAPAPGGKGGFGKKGA